MKANTQKLKGMEKASTQMEPEENSTAAKNMGASDNEAKQAITVTKQGSKEISTHKQGNKEKDNKGEDKSNNMEINNEIEPKSEMNYPEKEQQGQNKNNEKAEQTGDKEVTKESKSS